MSNSLHQNIQTYSEDLLFRECCLKEMYVPNQALFAAMEAQEVSS